MGPVMSCTGHLNLPKVFDHSLTIIKTNDIEVFLVKKNDGGENGIYIVNQFLIT